IRSGGDERTRLERARQEHADAQKSPATPAQGARPIEGATLASQVAVWIDLNSRYSQVQTARQQAAARQAALEREHNSLEAILAQKPAPVTSDDSGDDEEE